MEDKINNNIYFNNLLEKYKSEENNKKIQIEPIQICSYLDENFYNESYLKNTELLKQQLNKEKEIILNLIEKLNNKISINQLFNESSNTMNQLEDLSKKRKNISIDLEKQFKQTSIENLIKYTKLINQLTRIKKYFQVLLIINNFYNKVKLCIKNNLLSLSLKPFINLIELQNNLNGLKVPSGPKLINNEEITDQIFPHLTKVVDHVVGDTLLILEKKMKQELNKSLKDINWLGLSSSAIQSNKVENNSSNNIQQQQEQPSQPQQTQKEPQQTQQTQQQQQQQQQQSQQLQQSQSLLNTPSNLIESNEELLNKINNEKDQQQLEILNNKYRNRQNFIKNFTNLILLQLAIQKYNSKIQNSTITNNNQKQQQKIGNEGNDDLNRDQQKIEENEDNQELNNLKKQEKVNSSSNNNEFTKLWAINIILLPIIRGFKYHFQSDRVTNFIEKPEWAIHYIKKIIREYSRYLCFLQDELELNGVYYIDVHQWFIAGLVETVKNKFRGEIKLFLERPDHYKRYFYHTMEQIVDLQRFLLEEYSYPNSIEYGNVKGGIEMGLINLNSASNGSNDDNSNNNNNNNNNQNKIPVPFSIFQEKYIFDRWLELEIENCDLHFNALYNSDERFQLYYRDEFPDLDQLKPTNSAYELISILSSLTERYQLLTDVNLQFEFFNQIQINLLLRYRNELKSIISILSNDDHQNLRDFCYLFNSLNYVIKVLQDWDNDLIFIELYEHMNKTQKQKLQQQHNNNNNDNDYRSNSSSSLEYTSLSNINQNDDYSAFSVMISDYKQLLKSLKKKLVKDLFFNFISKTNNYLKRGTFSNQAISSGTGISSGISGISKNIFSFSNFNKQKSKLFNDNQQQQQHQQHQQHDSNIIEKDQNKENNDKKQDSLNNNNNKKQQDSPNKNIISINTDNDNYAQFDVSNEISNGLSILRYQLGIIYRSITPTKLSSIWKRLLIKIDKYLFNLLMNCQPKFTENDGKQFSKDIKTLLLIFNSFSNTPENYMKKIIESTILLRLNNQEFNQFKNEFSNKLNVNLEEELLQKYQIYNLTNDQINTLLKLRI